MYRDKPRARAVLEVVVAAVVDVDDRHGRAVGLYGADIGHGKLRNLFQAHTGIGRNQRDPRKCRFRRMLARRNLARHGVENLLEFVDLEWLIGLASGFALLSGERILASKSPALLGAVEYRPHGDAVGVHGAI